MNSCQQYLCCRLRSLIKRIGCTDMLQYLRSDSAPDTIIFTLAAFITFTRFYRQPHRRRSSKSASSIKSLVRKNDRPAEISTNGSTPAALVQPAGIDRTSPFVLKKYTRSSPQLLRYSTSSNSCPNSGWNGWVTRKCLFAHCYHAV